MRLRTTLNFESSTFSDPPEITGEQAYIQENEGIKLELVCIVHASPRANVSWYKNGHLLQHSEGRITIEKLSRKYVLAIRNLDETRDAGTYSCHAVNGLGEYRENFHVQGKFDGKLGNIIS